MHLIFSSLLMLMLLAPLTGRGETPEYVFGVLNQQSPQATAERWLPMLRYVGEKAGVKLRLRMGPTVQDTDELMGQGVFDFMFTNHNFQPQYDALGYRVIARWAGKPIRCSIVVAQDSPVTRLEGLNGKRVAYPNPEAFVAYAVPKEMLRMARVMEVEVLAGNQDAALNMVRFRKADAAAVNSRFLAEYQEKTGYRFRVIEESEDYPELAVIVHPRVSAAVRERVRDALVGMNQDPASAALLTQVGSPGFVAASDADYAAVRRVYRRLQKP